MPDEKGGGFEEFAGGCAGGVACDDAPIGVRGIVGETGGEHRARVGAHGVMVEGHQADGAGIGGLVELGPSGPARFAPGCDASTGSEHPGVWAFARGGEARGLGANGVERVGDAGAVAQTGHGE